MLRAMRTQSEDWRQDARAAPVWGRGGVSFFGGGGVGGGDERMSLQEEGIVGGVGWLGEAVGWVEWFATVVEVDFGKLL